MEDSPSSDRITPVAAENQAETRSTKKRMYHFSRAIYRELAPYVAEEKPTCQREHNRELVLRACERAMERLFTDRRYFAKPARSLFNEIRIYFPISCQLRVYMVVERNVSLALEFLSRLPEPEFDMNGAPRSCQAMTRKGKPCQRQPLPHNEYCPSHQHLAETFEEFEEVHEVELAAA